MVAQVGTAIARQGPGDVDTLPRILGEQVRRLNELGRPGYTTVRGSNKHRLQGWQRFFLGSPGLEGNRATVLPSAQRLPSLWVRAQPGVFLSQTAPNRLKAVCILTSC